MVFIIVAHQIEKFPAFAESEFLTAR